MLQSGAVRDMTFSRKGFAMSKPIKSVHQTRLHRHSLKQFVCILSIIISGIAVFSQTRKPEMVDFNRDIRPIFEKSCYACHSLKQALGGLRLDDKRLAIKGGISGVVIIPGKAQESRLLHRLLGMNNEARMPMGGAPLPQGQINLIRRWINEGATWEEAATNSALSTQHSALPTHWAYVKHSRPSVPEVKTGGWVRNPIDNFILARLEKEGMKPSQTATKETLIRRLYLDITGLPPTLAEVDDFVNDTRADAYEKVVDRLLASEQYGERQARHWLDLARYADTNGYEKDNRRVMWKYRDWLIRAFNEDKPFDQFTIEQIAGDMLPNATLDQKIATGFHRNTLLNQEGGVDPEEARFEVLIDRVSTTATVWLGATLACAQCHNHKYDPFTQKDFYRFMAFFNNNEYHLEGNPLERWSIEPKLYLPTPEQEAKRQEIEGEIANVETKLKSSTPEIETRQSEWEQTIVEAEKNWTTLDPNSFSSSAGTKLSKLPDQSILASAPFSSQDEYTITAKTNLSNITAIRLEALPDSSLPRGGPGCDPYGSFAIRSIVVQASPVSESTKREPVTFSDAKGDDGNGKALLSLNSNGWLIDQTNEATRTPRQVVLIAEKPFGNAEGTLLEIKIKQQHPFNKMSLGKFRLSVTNSATPTTIVNVHGRLRPLLAIARDQRSVELKKQLADYYLAITPLLEADRKRLNDLKTSLGKLNITTAEVMGEKPTFERPSIALRIKGSFTNRGEMVFADVPASLHPLPTDQMPNRLGLARWLVSRDNPLVARVTVNRFWEQIFGRGLVETSEDFGTQGERPSHPELLDWLATEFMQNWSMKSLIRLVVTSATYRQSSSTTPELIERDPYNRLLARGPRFRLEAEMLRDVTLAVSGLLNRKVGGPSVFPYQPEGIWNGPYSNDRWQASEGGDQFRRGIYTFIRRTAPYPSMVTFDAPSREFCTVRRVRTNTPLQSLTTLNDEAFFIAARTLATRMVNDAQGDDAARLIYGFRLCTSRKPGDEELKRLLALLEQQRSKYAGDSKAARALLKDESLNASQAADRAAWTVVANVLLNLDETLTKE
jgi:hypothetical protein